MRAQFVRGIDPKKSMELGEFNPKIRKQFLSDICQYIIVSFQNLMGEENIKGDLSPAFYFEGPTDEWKTEVDLRMKGDPRTFFIVWERNLYIAGLSGLKLIKSEHKTIGGAIEQIRKLL